MWRKGPIILKRRTVAVMSKAMAAKNSQSWTWSGCLRWQVIAILDIEAIIARPKNNPQRICLPVSTDSPGTVRIGYNQLTLKGSSDNGDNILTSSSLCLRRLRVVIASWMQVALCERQTTQRRQQKETIRIAIPNPTQKGAQRQFQPRTFLHRVGQTPEKVCLHTSHSPHKTLQTITKWPRLAEALTMLLRRLEPAKCHIAELINPSSPI